MSEGELELRGGVWEQIQRHKQPYRYNQSTFLREIMEFFGILPKTKEEKLKELKLKIKEFKL